MAASGQILITEEWSDAANTIATAAASSSSSSPIIALICDPKNSGKSTFSRHLLNLLLDKCFFFGDISSKRDHETYFNGISSLYDHYLKEYHLNGNGKMPLVINTPGWVKGIGLDILVDMLNHISPTHVIKIQISAESKNLPAGAFWLSNGNTDSVNVLEINSALHDSYNRSVLVRKDSYLLRELRILAYYRQCFPSDMPVSTIKELAHALAASIVGLAVSSVSEQLPHCVGLGIVRGIDTCRGVLHVITANTSTANTGRC